MWWILKFERTQSVSSVSQLSSNNYGKTISLEFLLKRTPAPGCTWRQELTVPSFPWWARKDDFSHFMKFGPVAIFFPKFQYQFSTNWGIEIKITVFQTITCIVNTFHNFPGKFIALFPTINHFTRRNRRITVCFTKSQFFPTLPKYMTSTVLL